MRSIVETNDACIVEEEAAEMSMEDHGEELKKKHAKKHRKRKERDETVDFGSQEGKNDHSEVLTVKKTSRKKAKFSKLRGDDGECCKVNDHDSNPNRKSCVENAKSKKKLDTRQNDVDFGEKGNSKKLMKDKEEKQRKGKKNKSKDPISLSSTEVIKDGSVGKDKGIEGFDYNEEEISRTKIEDGRDHVKEKIKRKKKNRKIKQKATEFVNSAISEEKDYVGGQSNVEVEHVKEKKKGNYYKDDHSNRQIDKKPGKRKSAIITDSKLNQHSNLHSSFKKQRDEKKKSLADGIAELDHIKRKKVHKSPQVHEMQMIDNGDPSMFVSDQKADHVRNSDHKKTKKRVKFSSNIEVFPISDRTNTGNGNQEKMSSFGKRYTQEEDKMLKEAVFNYIKENSLGKEGLNMVLNVNSYPQIKTCWKEIGMALPWRSSQSVYRRAHILLEGDEKRAWTLEQKEFIKKYYEEHGAKWKEMGKELGKFRVHVRDTWHRISSPNLRTGPWSQEEYQTLFDLVNMDLRMKASQEKASNNCMLRDNISWEAISLKMGTRTRMQCCLKWYGRIESSLVKKGQWANEDDYCLVNALLALDACCVEDVNWDALIPNRSGDLCRRRFKQMVNHLGAYGVKSFPEQVEVLSNRYCADLLEVRESTNGNATVEEESTNGNATVE